MKEAVKSDAVSKIQVLQSESSVKEGVAAVSNAEAALSLSLIHICGGIVFYRYCPPAG